MNESNKTSDSIGEAVQVMSRASHTAGLLKTGGSVAGAAMGASTLTPWGAFLSVLYASRRHLPKVIICVMLALLFIITAVIALPTVLFNGIFQTDPDSLDQYNSANMHEIADDLADIVADCIQGGYDQALAEVEDIIESGGYDYEASMEALINFGSANPDYDLCYILAAYSASMLQQKATPNDLKAKLQAVQADMFDVTFEEKTFTREVTNSETIPSEVEGEPDQVVENTTTETVRYVECTIHPFNTDVIETAFGIDLDAQYGDFPTDYRTAIETMANAMKLTLYGSTAHGSISEITDGDMLQITNGLSGSEARKEIVKVGLSLVGKVPYFWGGKSSAGWNDEWNKPRKVTGSGSTSTGQIRPFGMDCSGFTDWAYKTALGCNSIGAGSANQWANSFEISESQLLPGDLGFKARPGDGGINHVLIYVGKDSNGKKQWVHSSSSAGGVVLNTPSYVKYFRRVKGLDLESGNIGSNNPSLGQPIQTLRVNVTHYCACAKCCGKWAGTPTASGKWPTRGMVAMSSHYPFGTQIEINGTLYTVEDRGGTNIETDLSRVDIFVDSHQEALRLGRFWAEAKIYRLGR